MDERTPAESDTRPIQDIDRSSTSQPDIGNQDRQVMPVQYPDCSDETGVVASGDWPCFNQHIRAIRTLLLKHDERYRAEKP